jgi:hypothetical protein
VKSGFFGTFLFWCGAMLVVAVAAWFLFREQIHEWRTLRLLGRGIGPFYPEFEPLAIRAWVERAAPHVWRAWRTRDLGAIPQFATDAFCAAETARFAEEARQGQERDARLTKILKVHTLGLTMAGEGPAPCGCEVELRVELRGVDLVQGPAGAPAGGASGEREMQQFWTLRHDGRQWRLHSIRPATEDRTDLAKRPLPPPIAAWRRPQANEGEG